MDRTESAGFADTAALGDGGVETAAAPNRVELAVPGRRTVSLLAAGTVVDGDYRIVRLLGIGGMGVVYLARDLRLDRDVALKVHNAVERGAALRLAREATAMARVTHPNVVAVHRVGELDGAVFVAMEHVDGGTLRTWLGGGRSARDIVAAYAAAGDGLAAAHAAGLIHRDFKPDNVLIGVDGRPRVADFGLAVSSSSTGGAARDRDLETTAEGGPPASGELPRLTVTGSWVGTPAYMAPEQWEHGALDPRSDQFSFCVALWEALRGRRPFPGDRLAELTAAFDRGPQPVERGPVPRHVDAALRRGLARTVDARFPSMAALVAALRADPAARRRRIAAAALVLALGAVAVIATVTASRRGAVASPCDGIDEVTAVWNPARRAQVTAGFDALGVPWGAQSRDAAVASLDARAATWTAVAGRACRSARVTRTWTDALYSRARHCLDRRLGELDAVVGLLGSVDRTLGARAVTLIEQLPSATSCGDPTLLDLDVLPPADPTLAAAVARIEAQLDDVLGRQLAGRYDEAIAAADQLTAEVAALDYPPLRATLEHRRADLAAARRDADEVSRLGDAFFATRRAGLPLLALESALDLALAHASNGDHPAAALWWRLADADVVALRLDATFQARSARVHAAILDHSGKLDDARIVAEQALQRLGQSGELDTDTAVLDLIDALAVINEGLGQYDQAIAYGRRVVAALEAKLGPAHPRLAAALGNLGLSLSSTGDHAAAEATQQRALAVAQAGYPENNVKIGYALHNLGSARIGGGRYPEAIEALREAVRVLTIAVGPDHEDTALSEGELGLALTSNHQFAEARTVLEAALAHTLARHGPDSTEAAVVLHNLGSNAGNAGDLARCRDHLEQAIATYRRHGGQLTSEASAHADLASTLLELREPAAAVVSATAALERYQGSGVDPDVIARVEMLLGKARWGAGDQAGARAAMAAAASHVVDDEALRDQIAAWQAAHR